MRQAEEEVEKVSIGELWQHQEDRHLEESGIVNYLDKY